MIYRAGRTYILVKDLKVRTGPGVNYSQKYYKELLAQDRAKAYDQLFAVLKSDSKIVAMKVITNGNEVWIKFPSGYVLAKRNKEIFIDNVKTR